MKLILNLTDKSVHLLYEQLASRQLAFCLIQFLVVFHLKGFQLAAMLHQSLCLGFHLADVKPSQSKVLLNLLSSALWLLQLQLTKNKTTQFNFNVPYADRTVCNMYSVEEQEWSLRSPLPVRLVS